MSPTPDELGLALSSLTYNSTAHPISVVARFKAGSDVASVYLSSTEADSMGVEMFASGFVPQSTPAALRLGGVSTTAPASEGWLLVNDGQDKRIRLINLEVAATTSDSCSRLTGNLTAVIPDTEGDISLSLPGRVSTIRSLAQYSRGRCVFCLSQSPQISTSIASSSDPKVLFMHVFWQRSHQARVGFLTLCVGGTLLAANAVSCGDESLPGIGTGVDGGPCLDEDGDGYGYGRGCTAGSDCDDSDPSIGPCEVDDCATPSEGCSCDSPGVRVDCGETVSEVAGQKVCGLGDRVCNPDGTWGQCIINNSVTLLSDGDPKRQAQTLGAATNCPDACDPYCKTFVDDPSGLGDPDGGITSTDAGITLTGVDGSVAVPPICAGGTLGVCGHHVCETGVALGSTCDETGLPAACAARGTACNASNPCCYGLGCQSGTCLEPPAPTFTVFEEPFFNAVGWSQPGNWSIGPAVGGAETRQSIPHPPPTVGSRALAGVRAMTTIVMIHC